MFRVFNSSLSIIVDIHDLYNQPVQTKYMVYSPMLTNMLNISNTVSVWTVTNGFTFFALSAVSALRSKLSNTHTYVCIHLRSHSTLTSTTIGESQFP